MELAKITTKGQVTIPIAIRKKLGVKDGDKILFVEDGDNILIMNASMRALLEAQRAFQGVADQLGVQSEEDVVRMVKEIRAERSGQYKCE